MSKCKFLFASLATKYELDQMQMVLENFTLFLWEKCENSSLKQDDKEVQLTENLTEEDIRDKDIYETVDSIQTVYENLMFVLLPLNFCLNGIAFYVFGRYQKIILPSFIGKLCGADMVYEFSLLIILIFHKIYAIPSTHQLVPFGFACIIIFGIILSMLYPRSF